MWFVDGFVALEGIEKLDTSEDTKSRQKRGGVCGCVFYSLLFVCMRVCQGVYMVCVCTLYIESECEYIHIMAMHVLVHVHTVCMCVNVSRVHTYIALVFVYCMCIIASLRVCHFCNHLNWFFG